MFCRPTSHHKSEIGGACGTYEGHDRYVQGFGGDIWWKETTWKPRHRWKNNIKIELQEVVWGILDRMILAQARGRLRTRVKVL